MPTARQTQSRFDIWKNNHTHKRSGVMAVPGSCVGHIIVNISGDSNQSAQFAIEDYLHTLARVQGVIVRTGQLDVRSKFDVFVDIKKSYGQRQIVWNNFIDMPNPSGAMSIMRFERGQ